MELLLLPSRSLARRLVVTFAALLLCVRYSCAEPVKSQFAREESDGTIQNPLPKPSPEFIAYRGSQRCPVVARSTVDRRFALPVYFGPAEKPYHIIGSVILHGVRATGTPIDETAALSQAVSCAKLHGADAFILRPLTDRLRSAMQGNQPLVFAWGFAIKWGPAPL